LLRPFVVEKNGAAGFEGVLAVLLKKCVFFKKISTKICNSHFAVIPLHRF
jgi:hypothetical protein